jgi:GT2 family glycosyltransferase
MEDRSTGDAGGPPAGDGRVAVVIVNLNAGPLLGRSLAAVGGQTVPPTRTIVVDNGSTDGSADGIEERYPGVEVLRLGENRGFAGGNNVGVQAAADCDWIALLNPDAFPEADWLAALLEATRRRPEFAFFGSRLLQADAPERLDGAGDAYHVSGMAWRRDHGSPAAEAGRTEHEVFSPCAAAALYRRDAFLEDGGFDERFFCYYEDNDLSFRLRLAGHRCLYVPDAVVHHVGSAIAGADSEFTVYHSQRNLVWTFVKNMPAPLVWLYLPQHLLVNLLAIAWYATNGRARAVLRAQRDALLGLPRVLAQRRAVQADRRAGALAVRRQMTKGTAAYAESLGRARRAWRNREAARR